MIVVRKSEDRGRFDHGWLRTAHTFSFGRYIDRRFMGFRSLRVINEDHVAPGQGFDTHEHENMEIITWVVSGALKHKDSTGSEGILRPGEVQRMSAGSGIAHSEFNPSKTESVHLLQIWLLPDRAGHEPGYDQKPFPIEGRTGKLQLLVSPDGAEGSLTIHQDARLFATVLPRGRETQLSLSPGRHAWVQVIKGDLTLNGTHALAAGDGAAVSDESSLTLRAGADAEAIVFDLA